MHVVVEEIPGKISKVWGIGIHHLTVKDHLKYPAYGAPILIKHGEAKGSAYGLSEFYSVIAPGNLCSDLLEMGQQKLSRMLKVL